MVKASSECLFEVQPFENYQSIKWQIIKLQNDESKTLSTYKLINQAWIEVQPFENHQSIKW